MLRPMLFLLYLSLLPGCNTILNTTQPFHYPEGHYAGAELRYIHEVPVLTVQGTPESMGEQVAELAIKASPRLADYPHDLLNRVWAGWTWDYFMKQGKKLLPQFPADHRREMEAMIRHSPQLPADAILAGNTLFDVKKMVACSSIIVEPTRARSGAGLLGRNLDFPDMGYLHEYTLVTVYRPNGKHAFASVGFPGMVGVLSGINDAGLALTMHEVYQSADGAPKFDEKGVPYALVYRRVMEECTTIEEAAALIAGVPRTTSTNVALLEVSGRGAVVEVSARSVVVRPTVNGVNHCTNHFQSKPLRPLFLWNMYGTLQRDKTLAEYHDKPSFSVLEVTQALGDVQKGTHTVQSMVFQVKSTPQPAYLLHLAMGPVPVTANPYQTVDLTPLLLPGKAEAR